MLNPPNIGDLQQHPFNNMRKKLQAIATILLCVTITPQAFAQTTKVGKGSYTNTFPGTDVAGRNGYPTGTPYLIDSLKNKPVPTNDWWSAKLKSAHCDNLFNYPLTMKTVNSGLVTSYIPWGVISDIEPITVGVKDLNHTAPYISAYSDWHITIEWKNGTNRFQTTTALGMPFLYFQKNTSDVAQVKVNTGTATLYNEVILIENAYNGADFVVFAPKGSSWSVSGGTYTSSLNNKNYWSMVMLPQNSNNLKSWIDSMQKFAFVEPIRTQADWKYNASENSVTTTFNITSKVHEGKDSLPLVGILPHQWSRSNAAINFQNYTYSTVRGAMKMTAANTFGVKNTFKGILPTLPYVDLRSKLFDPVLLQKKIADIQYEGLSTWTDSYNEGQVMNRLIQTARIAREMGDEGSVKNIVKTVKNRLENWLTHQSPEVAFLFYYNKPWSALIGYPAGHGQDNNINDHHFHWGYFIHAASFIEEVEPGWAKSYGEMIDLLVRDAATPNRNDNMFPYLRNFNPYSGHCWANGFATFPQGNDQESTSESMQFNSSLIHWGMLTQNNEIRDLGIYLYTTEQSAIEEYWFDTKQRNFQKTQQYALVSRVWGNSYDNGTFWTNDIAASYGIELYPIHGGSFYLAHDTTYAKRLWSEMSKNTGILSNQVNDNLWHDVYWSYLAYLDAPKAIQMYNSFTNRNLKFGISDAQTYHWLHALNALGRLQPQITSNHPLAMAFKKGNDYIYAAQNYGKDSIVVLFSDGYKLTVPPRKLKTSLDFDVIAKIGSEFTQLYRGTPAELYFDSLNVAADSIQWYRGSQKLATQTKGPFTLKTAPLSAGNYLFHARVFKGEQLAASNFHNILVGEQTPYNKTTKTIPGTFESGHFDEFEGGNGQGITYVDFDVKNEGNFRTSESVDASNDAKEGAIVTFINAGEWTEYSVNILSDGLYKCAIRYANGNAGTGGKLTFLLDGKIVASNIQFPSTGKWDTYGSVEVGNIPMIQGKRVLQLFFEDGGMNMGKLQFSKASDLAKAMPVANAGGNKSVALLVDSALIDGSKSKIGSLGYINYQWKQIYGPNRLVFSAMNAQKTVVRGLKEGVYKIQLKVSDSLQSDQNEIFIFVQDGGNMLPNVTIAEPTKGATYISGQKANFKANADDLDGNIKIVEFWLNNAMIYSDSTAPYQFSQMVSVGNYTLFVKALDDQGGMDYSDTITFNAMSLAGDWKLEPIAGAMAVGPTLSSLNWWSNSMGDVSTRSCLFDDIYKISENGTFKNIMGDKTWLEGWQNSGVETCATPKSPHDGSVSGNWTIDSINGDLVLLGGGQFLGLPKATNNGELGNGATQPTQRSYQINLSANRLVAAINFAQGFWQFKLVRATQASTSLNNINLGRVYPNPMTAELQIITNAQFIGARIMDESGRTIMNSTTNIVDVSKLGAGLYLVEVISASGKEIHRVVKH